MAEPQEHPLLHRAIALAQEGKVEDAHALLNKITSEDPTQELAWLWLVQTEPDHHKRIRILEECLRHNPNSEYARKGLAGFRTGPLTGQRPPGKPPTYYRPKEGTGPMKRKIGCRWRAVFAITGSVVVISLIIGAILFYPQWKDYFGLPDDPLAFLNLPENPLAFLQPQPGGSPTPTGTSTIPQGVTLPAQATLTETPTVTRTPTISYTPSLTRTVTQTPLPTLYLGIPVADEPALLFMDDDSCGVFRLPISGGAPESLTEEIPLDCDRPRISPDGTKLAFLGLPPDEWISVMNVDGSRRRVFTKLPASGGEGRTIWAFEYSPDGRQIGFVASGFAKDTLGNIHIDNAFGFLYTAAVSSGYAKQQKALGVDATLVDLLAWSPNGQWVFTYDRGNPLEDLSYPFAFRASDSRTVWISQDDPYLGHYDWSPDSQSLASLYPKKPSTAALPEDAPQDQNYIIISGLDESKQYIALADKDYDPKFGVRWFPDQSTFLLYQTSTKLLVAVSPTGEVLNTVAALTAAPEYIAWSGDGEWIAILEKSSKGNNGTLMIVHPDGTDLRILAREVGLAPVVWK